MLELISLRTIELWRPIVLSSSVGNWSLYLDQMAIRITNLCAQKPDWKMSRVPSCHSVLLTICPYVSLSKWTKRCTNLAMAMILLPVVLSFWTLKDFPHLRGGKLPIQTHAQKRATHNTHANVKAARLSP